jgi:4-amino-4-deoxy-L-arabinose transferase-like glycosyltransferase
VKSPDKAVNNSEDTNRLWLTRMVQVLAILLLLRLLSLWFNNTGLFFDEAQYWLWAGEPAFGYYSKPPVIAWIIAAFTAVCGDSEFCIRIASPILHTGTAYIIYLLATHLFDARTGFWSALFYATLPAVSLSSTLISTDVPLLFFWSVALYAFVRLEAEDKLKWSIMLGLALGAGLMSKYAMLYFLPCLLVYSLFTNNRPHILFRRRFWLAAGIALICFIPNLWWNYQYAFMTAIHTGDNIGWSGGFPHIQEFSEFFFSQFAVFGPVLFGIYLAALLRLPVEGMNRKQLFLLCFSVPILLIICFQALMSKAYANWAALTYIGGTILVTDLMVNIIPDWWRKLSMPIHIGVFIVVSVAVMFSRPGQLPLPEDIQPFDRMHGAREIAAATREYIDTKTFRVLLTDERRMSALMGYYLRDLDIARRAWRSDEFPDDHFELTRPFRTNPVEPVFYLTSRRNPADVVQAFSDVEYLGSFEPGFGEIRQVWFYSLNEFNGASNSR